MCWKLCSSCWSLHLLREEFLSAPIHSHPLWFAVSVLQLPPRVAFFSHIGYARCYCSSMPSPSDTTRSILRRSLLFRQQHSLSLLRSSLARSVCSDVPISLSCSPPPAAHTLRIALNFSPQKVDTAAGRSAVCATAKGDRAYVNRAVRRAVAAAATPSPILILSHAHLVECPHQGGN
jgi:hypothetical protein